MYATTENEQRSMRGKAIPPDGYLNLQTGWSMALSPVFLVELEGSRWIMLMGFAAQIHRCDTELI